ncbi:MAG: pyruvate dehydrogenase (acetyl-transferring), homodimeric type [Pseudomonadales bacterium]|nr:pyruvate dehydrogenase (acetyl-transferring), homodimeric type [Pseudomonadales bacterium]
MGDIDPQETREWLDAMESLVRHGGRERAAFILYTLAAKAYEQGLKLPSAITTPYRNTIHFTEEKRMPGDVFIERRIRSLIRWNAMAMVMRANTYDSGLGGHIATFSSAAMLYDIGFNYFFRGGEKADLIYYQGHSAPGIYARSFLERRLTEEQINNFRREVEGNALSSYPHPWLMPDYWQFPTVSMGLGPIQAIYQAHVMKYQQKRGLVDHGDRKVWAFLGDGECDEPESLGAISLAGREKFDNLIFVINCNLQRLDGPVRGNGKIIQELEGNFRGAGWNVIKVLWGRHWDPLLEKDKSGLLQKRMDEVCDGELQNYKNAGGAYTREHFFGKYPELLKLVEDMSDNDIAELNRGGHDPYKVYAAYWEAVNNNGGKPTVILAQTVKGYGMGAAGEATNDTHGVKKLDEKSLSSFRDRFDIPLSDEELETIPFYLPPEDSPEMEYMRERRAALGGYLPARRRQSASLPAPPLTDFEPVLAGSGGREISTTMAFVRLLSILVKDKQVGGRMVPIVPDEARTFGMEGMFRQLGIYSSVGQKYTPVDAGQMLYYKESEQGQILEEGINEAGAMAAWMACATSYSTHDYPLVPFFIYYSMFGFQRVGDLAWAAGDSSCRGFLIGATAGRTTLAGEGLQHQDGHSLILAASIPNCVSYDPCYAYEMAVIIQRGLVEMLEEQKNRYYYITAMNENYVQPAMPAGVEEGIIRGMYCLQREDDAQVQLLGSGTILREVEAAAVLLKEQFNIKASIWSVTSFNELRRDGFDVERWNRLHPTSPPQLPYVTALLRDTQGPVVAATDYVKMYASQISPWVPRRYEVLGTDGFGRSDVRSQLRKHFEVDRHHIVLATLHALQKDGALSADVVEKARVDFNIPADKQPPLYS